MTNVQGLHRVSDGNGEAASGSWGGGVDCFFYWREVKEGCLNKVTFEQSPKDSEGTNYQTSRGKRTPGGGNSNGKGCELETQ